MTLITKKLLAGLCYFVKTCYHLRMLKFTNALKMRKSNIKMTHVVENTLLSPNQTLQSNLINQSAHDDHDVLVNFEHEHDEEEH